ncbi:MAG: nitroreductase [Desulfomonilaceae bacterium]|nr:nitroreductase [Desulfomonilaceae bacterium]
MDLLEAIRTRSSVRAFRDEPVPRRLLEQVLLDATRAPSAINMQPWDVHMVLGDERKRLSRRLLRSFKERAVTCGPGASRPIPDRFMARARYCADAMTPLVERMGSDFKTYINEGSLNFYGAPAVALIFLDECFPAERMVDVGSLVAYLVLSAEGHGVNSCPIGLVQQYEDEIKDQLNVPESKKLIISVALGFAEPDSPVNEFRSPRADLNEVTRWVD